VLRRYGEDGAEPVICDEKALNKLGVGMSKAPVASVSGDLARHDPERLAREILRIFVEKSPTRLYGGK
jgi:hypothetical protein